jgi:hypothetical protein
MRWPRRGGIALAAAAILALVFVPLPYRACPTWDVTVVDESGWPLPAMSVRLVYQDYSAEDRSHEAILHTSARGAVTFPERSGAVSIAVRCYYLLLAAGAGFPSGIGRHATVVAFGQGRMGRAMSGDHAADWTGSPDRMQSRIIANPIPIAASQ